MIIQYEAWRLVITRASDLKQGMAKIYCKKESHIYLLSRLTDTLLSLRVNLSMADLSERYSD